MDKYLLKRLSLDDGDDVYLMLQNIDEEENAFKNPAKGLTIEAFHKWLEEQNDWSNGVNLPCGFVRQSIYWLYVNDLPVGCGKIRYGLTEESRKQGGNIGYAIAKGFRGKGYASVLLKLLLEEANRLGIKEKLLTVEKDNYASKRVIEKNGGVLFDENNARWFFRF